MTKLPKYSMTNFSGIFAWDGKCGYFSVEKHRCENPTCVSITSNTFFCLNGNVCKSVQIYKSFHSTSKLPGHSSCLFWCNRQIKPTRVQDITIQFVWATKQSLLPQKPAAAKKKRQKIVQMLMVSHMFLTASNQNCLWNLFVSWTDTCWTPHLGPCDYEERMCISKSFQQPCALSGDEGWVCIMKIERKKRILTWFPITCEKRSKVQSQRHHSRTWLKDYRCRKRKLSSFSNLVTFLVLTESKITDISRHAMDPIETY